MCVNVLSACLSVYNVNACCLRKSEEGFGSPGPGDIDGYEPPRRCWEFVFLSSSARATHTLNHEAMA